MGDDDSLTHGCLRRPMLRLVDHVGPATRYLDYLRGSRFVFSPRLVCLCGQGTDGEMQADGKETVK